MIRQGSDVQTTNTPPTVNANAARRRAKAEARQRRAQQRQVELAEARKRPRVPQTAHHHSGSEATEVAGVATEPDHGDDGSGPGPTPLRHWLFDQDAFDLEEPAPPVGLAVDASPDVGGPPYGADLPLADVPLSELEAWLADHSVPATDDQPRSGRRSHRRRPVLGIVAGVTLLLVGGAFAWRTVTATPQARLTLETTTSAGETLVVGAGTIDMAGLVQEARRVDRPEALQRVDGDTYLLSMPLTVGPGGQVQVAGTELRLLSQPGNFVGLEARGGALRLREAVVTSWDPAVDAPDTDVADGRAYILARDGGRLDVVDSSASMLGYDAFERYGISWRTAGTEGLIDGSTFTGNFYGAYMHGAEPMQITDSIIEGSVSYGLDPHSGSRDFTIVGNTFRNNGKHGMILAEDCTGVEVRDNESYGNGGHGIVVFGESNDALLEGNRVHDNGLAGISVNASDRVTVRDNDVWANTMGITVQDEATLATVEGNRVSGNREDGIVISSEQSTATVVGNRLDHNGRAGVWVSDGQATIGPDNRIVNNESGVRLVDETPSVSVFDNLLVENYKDGFSLVVSDGITISGNRIVDNDAAFSVRTAGLATPFFEGNIMEGNELGPERVREPDPQPAP